MDASRFPNLDPELIAFVEILPDMTRSLEDIPAAREFLRSVSQPTGPIPGEDEVDVKDATVAGPTGVDVSVRTYRPVASAGTTSALLYIHGGGFCLGDLDSEHALALTLARVLQTTVVSVDYRLAPEHPFPAGVNDCYAALEWLAELPRVERIAVIGQSAGAALAAAITLMARDRGGPRIAFQALGIPVLDDRLCTTSMAQFVDTPLWSRPQARKSWELYLRGSADVSPYAAPARAPDLSGLPPAYIATMELDPLRDEGINYAMRLLAAGVSVELHSYPGTFHGSAAAVNAAVSKRAAAEMTQALCRGLATP